MTNEVISLIFQGVAAFSTLFGLGFIGKQIQQGRKTIDFQTLQTFLKDVKEYEGALFEARDKERAFVEFLNFVETYTMSLNDGLVPKVSRKAISEKLCDVIAIILSNQSWHKSMMEAITSVDTFTGLALFYKTNKEKIDGLCEAQKLLTVS